MNSLYVKIYEKQRVFYETRPRAKKAVYFADKAATAAIALLYAFLCAYVCFFATAEQVKSTLFFRADFRDVYFLFISPFASVAIVSLFRKIVNAKRPYECGITPLFMKKRAGNSFPSRHLLCAAVISYVSFSYLIPVGIAATIFEIVLSYTRFTCGWHFPRDLFFGMLFGYGTMFAATLLFPLF